jgi:adenylate kinase
MSDRFRLTAMSSGDRLRREIKDGSEIGRAASHYVQSGTLVPDEIITGVMLSGIAQLPSGSGFILDGFPRTVPQAEALERGLAAAGRPLHAVIDFQIADEEVVTRIVSRRVCSQCGATYNAAFLPPKVAGRCDLCGGALEQRVDDRRDVVVTRLETYRRQTAPLVEYYTQRRLLRALDAAAPAERVEERLGQMIASLDTST